ncbi:breast cancer type 2 susceptibility protein isoform X2 [Nothobranchius furzeri]|uniref:breast cancer type 2 susceptibility protein isoform X2 n=1 Tax=Nothobranchius furzeri TaxID=105023 RepID=UPI003904990E
MDVSLKNMYDAFKDEIWKELGPLDSNWFEVLTTQAPAYEGNAADTDELCANQEGQFKTPLNKTALDSQLFSTPKVFRHRRVVSPEDEQFFTAAQEKGSSLPWMATQSPCMFPPSGQEIRDVKSEGAELQNADCFDLLDTPNKSAISYAKHISESLGAQINPDISWTSSLNTPPAVASTLILSKTDESPCPVTVTADRNVVFVRKLFPSLSKSVEAPKNKPTSSAAKGAISSKALDFLQTPLSQSSDLWQQGDAVEDEEVHNRVLGAFDGPEKALSSFFPNSFSTLRKIKSDRIKRKQIIQTKENCSSSKDVVLSHNAVSSGEVTSDLASGGLPSTPLAKTADPAVSQWSPLNLSEIPPCALESNISTQQPRSDISSVQLTRPSTNIQNTGFVTKRRKFIYTVSPSKMQVQEGHHPRKMDPSSRIQHSGQEADVKLLVKVTGDGEKADLNLRNTDGEEINVPVGAQVQEFDMSQLCKDFAHDFSQVPNFGQQEKGAKQTLNNFSPSACLSAMKHAKQKEKQTSILRQSDGISNRGQTLSFAESTVNDSGFQSGDGDIIRTMTSLNPHSENTGRSRALAATASLLTEKENMITHLGCEAETTLQKSEKRQTLDTGKDQSRIENKRTQQPSSVGNIDKTNYIPLNGQTTDCLSDKTNPSGSASGFKTASNKGIHILSANLEKAKRLFEEAEGKGTFLNQFAKRDRVDTQNNSLNNGSLTRNSSNSNQLTYLGGTIRNVDSLLTASEEADVTELCSLLEDSQFEFTQFKTAKLKWHDQDDNIPHKPDKELDPDFLADIDFDDSFSSEMGRNQAVHQICDKIASDSDDITNGKAANQSSDMSLSCALKEEGSSVAAVAENIYGNMTCLLLPEPNTVRSEREDILELDTKSSPMHSVRFTTARGNILKVSKKCFSKAKALFADLEDNLTDQKSQDKQIVDIDGKTEQNSDMCKKDLEVILKDKRHVEERVQDCSPKIKHSVSSPKQVQGVGDRNDTNNLNNHKSCSTMFQSDFSMASGKGISLSAKCMQQADVLFKDCNRDDMFEKSLKSLHESTKSKKSFSEYKILQVDTSAEQEPGCKKFENLNAELIAQHSKEPHMDKVQMSSNGSLALKNAKSFHGNPFITSNPFSTHCTSKNIDSSVTGDEFCTASGKKVFVSTDAMRKAEHLLNRGHLPEDKNMESNQKENASRTGVDESYKKKATGFQTAGGKEVSISSASLKKAKALFKECEREDEMSKNTILTTGPPIRSGGFSAASGKPVVLSSEALQKAKAIFSDISLSTDISNASDMTRSERKHEEDQDYVNKRDGGFTTAGGTKVHVSQKNLLKAKCLFKECDTVVLTKTIQETAALFTDCDVDGNNRVLAEDLKDQVNLGEPRADQRARLSVSKEPEHGLSERTNKQVKPKEEALPQQSNGFLTASGKGVNISSKALKRAKTLLNNCKGVENQTNNFPPHSTVSALSFGHAGFSSASGKPVRLSSESLQKSKSFFSGIDTEIPDRSQTMKGDRKQDHCTKTERIQSNFTTARGGKVSVSQNHLLNAKSLQEVDDSASEKATQVEDVFYNEQTGGTADGISNIPSEHTSKALIRETDILKKNLSKCKTKPRNIPEEIRNGCTEDTGDQVKQEVVMLPQQSGRFQTASGKAVAVSHKALTRAHVLLSDSEGTKDKIHDSLPLSKILSTDTPICNSRFSAASGKPVAFSSDALQKAKAFFSNIPTISATNKSDEKHNVQSNAETCHGGFTTAGGRNVHVSEESLMKAKHLLGELSEECHHSLLSSQDTQELNISKEKDLETISCFKVAPSRSRDVLAKKQGPAEGRSLNLTSGTDYLSEEEDSNMFGFDLSLSRYSKRAEVLKSDESSDRILTSLNLTSCTETQHKFLAQEALDCTKALLEDEVLADQSFSDDSKPIITTIEEEKGRRKILTGEPDLIGPPPSKRRLLEEFDRSVESPKVLHPVKSCPDGLMKDRRVFKYSASLCPNITKPHGNTKVYMDTRLQRTMLPHRSTPGGGRTSHSKMLAFVPPFIQNSKREIPKMPELKENTRTPAFVPPFKKLKPSFQDSSSKEEEKHQVSIIMKCNNNTYTPPVIKYPNTTNVTCSADPENQKATYKDDVPVDFGGLSPAGKALDMNSSVTQDEFQNIELARDMQDMRIRKKKHQTIRPLPGSLFLSKTSGVTRIPLKVAVNGKSPARCTPEQLYKYGVQKLISEVTSETAESFRFSLLQFIKWETFLDGGGVQLADGGWVIPRKDWTAGKEEFYRALCDTPGVDPKLISEAWVYNHYRWIVWKQASMEKCFPETMGSFCLTPEQVLLQLKYRYDVEVDHSRRPALRKIVEKDDTAVKTLVLCVFVRLTDGWYAIKAQLDEPLTAMLHKGLLTVGGKLIIHGAQLVGSQDACSPLEAPDSLMIKIFANSSRRARWDAKLGFHRDPRPFLLPLSSLYGSGGPVGCADIVILRSYPIQWMERKAGGVVFRSTRAEEKEARRYDSQKHKTMEMLFTKIQADFEKEEQGNRKPQQKRKSMSHQDMASLQDGEELYEAFGDDLAYLEACLSEQQLEALHAYRRSLMDKRQAELQDRYRRALDAEGDEKGCPKRDVTPVWRLSVADSRVQHSSVYQLNLWRPSSDLQSLLKEGCRYKVYNLVASDGKKRSGIETVQLTGTKKTQFQDLQASQAWLSGHFQPRVSTNFETLQNAEFQPLCGEVDLTGYIINVIDEQGSSPAFYLADGRLNFVKVRCFNSFSQAGLEDVVKPGVLLSLSNLQLRGQSLHPAPVVYAGDLTVFSTNPKEAHLQEALSHLKTVIQSRENFFQIAEEKLSHLIKTDATSSVSCPYLQPQTPVTGTHRKQDPTTNVTFQKPARNLGSFTPVSRNPPAATPSEKDPRCLKRKRALDYLSRIPSPPPLSHLGSFASPCVNKTFNPPRRSGTPRTLQTVQTPAQKPTDSLVEDEWVNDEELAMIDTQALLGGDLS